MSDPHADDHLADVVRRELQLLDPQLRASTDDVAALLHPDFREHGSSGRVWDRDAIVAALLADPDVSGTAIDLEPVALGPDVVLLTYRMAGDPGSLRSSVWLRDPTAGWRLRFHQGTRAAP